MALYPPQGLLNLSDDVTTNATFYPILSMYTNGQVDGRVSSTKITFNPSTGNLSATAFTGPLTGNASSATKLQTARTINGVNFDGTANITVTANTTNALTFGTHLTGTSFNGSSAVTIGTDATNANTASTIVSRDASGNFSAGTITASLSGNATSSTSSKYLSGNSAFASSSDPTRYTRIATLPTSTLGTYDHFHVALSVNSGWPSTGNSVLDVYLGNRNGLTVRQFWLGDARTNVGLVAYTETDGSVTVYVVTSTGSFTSWSVAILDSIQATVYPSDTAITAPTGTLAFDSRDPVTYVPQLEVQNAGTLKYNGATVWTSANDGSTSTLDAHLLDGLTQTASATASTIVARDAGGNGSFNSVNATATSTIIATNGFPGWNVQVSSDTVSNAGYYLLFRSRGTSAAKTATAASDPLGYIGFRGYTGSAFFSQDSARIWSIASEAGSTGYGGSLLFGVAATGTTSTAEAMRIAPSGNLLVGGTSDNGTDSLQITGSASCSTIFKANTSASTASSLYQNGFNVQSSGVFGANVCGGAHFNGTSWIPDATTASILSVNSSQNGGFLFYGNTGLTVGTAFSPTQRASLDAGGSLTLTGSIAVNSGTVTTTATTFNLADTVATSVNAFGAGTTVSIADNTAAQTVTIGTTSTGASTYSLGTGATASATTKTVNLGTGGATGSTTNINIGSGQGGTTTIASPNVTFSATSANSIQSASTTVNFLTATTTTISIGSATTTFNIGNNTAAQTISIGSASTGASTYNLGTGATAAATTKTVNLGTGGAASSTTNVNIGSANGGTTTLSSPSTSVDGKLSVTNGAYTAAVSLGTALTTITPDGNQSNSEYCTVTAAASVALPTNLASGQTMIVTVNNTGASPVTITFNASYKMPGGTKSFSLTNAQYMLISITNANGTYFASAANNMS